jgi:hypothetical protein
MTPRYCLSCLKRLKLAHRLCHQCRLDQAQAWEDFKPSDDVLPISEPPCRDCHYFRPRRIYTEHGLFNGVVLCTNTGEQCNDFSCYKAKS